MSAAVKVLERARAADVQLVGRGGRLAYDAPSDVSPDLFAQLRECKVELLELLRHERLELLDPATDPRGQSWVVRRADPCGPCSRQTKTTPSPAMETTG